ncbi:MAG: 50S ribosomal protein L9 [Eubacteriales bacterium SKADARSKE-1]|nr:50S ribosomal protein L9 [Eubacteriales bacterium SKADARSKE-1]
MKVILLSDVKGSGKAGDLVNVSDGYARNFLLPKKFAREADAVALSELKSQQAAKQHKIDEEIKAAKNLASKLEGKIVNITAKAGENGKLFGSVTAKEIAAEVSKAFNIKVDKRKIHVKDDIKTFGTYECEVKLYQGINAKIYVVVRN